MNHFKKIAGVLEAHGLDAVLLTCEANRFYASGFHSSGTDGVAIVTRNHNYYFTDSRYTEAAARHVRDAEIRETDREHPSSALINEVTEKEHITRMGYEDEYMTAADFRRFSEKLHCELVPATELLWTLRAVKDQAELECMIQAQRIAEKALADILGEIRPGITEKEIAALLLYKMLHYGAEDKSFDPIVVSGANGSLPHGVPSEKPIQAGEFVTMDFGCKFGGYCSDMTRTVAVGHVTEEMETVYNTVLKAQLVPGLDQADILEIVDHHRLADIETNNPIYVRNEPVGSSTTIVADMYQEKGLMPSAKMAGLMAAAIVSDTVMFKSPTCTQRDIDIANRMSRIANVSLEELGQTIFSAATGEDKSAESIIRTDYKEFHIGGHNLAVSQITCLDSDRLMARKEEFLATMETIRKKNGLDIVLLMITNVLVEGSYLLYSGDTETIRQAFNITGEEKNCVFLSKIMSRKKQIIPSLSALWG